MLFLKRYKNRPTTFVEARDFSGWAMKLYQITAYERSIDPELLERACKFADAAVEWPGDAQVRFGFMTLHAGEHANWLLVDLWIEDMLRHFLFKSELENPFSFKPCGDDGTMACVWEMEVLKHERDAWVRSVLCLPEEPDFNGYLADVLEIPADV